MDRRTNTTKQTVFHLSLQKLTVEFPRANQVKITIPKDSGWRFPYHWHSSKTHRGCHRVTCVKGHLQIYAATPFGGTAGTVCPAGSDFTLKHGDHHAWGPYNTKEELVVLLEIDNAVLYRNMCSAILDVDHFPYLSSTPLWIRLLHKSLYLSPNIQRWVLSVMLWVQLQMMCCTHDFWQSHGKINAPYLWEMLHPFELRPPDWTTRTMWWSQNAISKGVQHACYWIGRLLLGLKGEYPEYTLGHGSVQSMSKDVCLRSFPRVHFMRLMYICKEKI